MILIISLTFNFDIKKYKKNFIITMLTIGLIFNLSKNIQRIYDNNFINNPYGMISKKVGEQKKKNIGDFTYYIGWYGDTPISNNEIQNKKFKKKIIFNIIY